MAKNKIDPETGELIEDETAPALLEPEMDRLEDQRPMLRLAPKAFDGLTRPDLSSQFPQASSLQEPSLVPQASSLPQSPAENKPELRESSDDMIAARDNRRTRDRRGENELREEAARENILGYVKANREHLSEAEIAQLERSANSGRLRHMTTNTTQGAALAESLGMDPRTPEMDGHNVVGQDSYKVMGPAQEQMKLNTNDWLEQIKTGASAEYTQALTNNMNDKNEANDATRQRQIDQAARMGIDDFDPDDPNDQEWLKKRIDQDAPSRFGIQQGSVQPHPAGWMVDGKIYPRDKWDRKGEELIPKDKDAQTDPEIPIVSKEDTARINDIKRFDEKIAKGNTRPGLDKGPNLFTPYAKQREEAVAKLGYDPSVAPEKGTEMDGYVFIGGNPSDPKSWRNK